MAARDFNAKNIIVGAATVYAGPDGKVNTKLEVEGGALRTAQDPLNVKTDGAAASWYHLGYTMDGVTLNIEPTYQEVMVDQLLDVARLFKTAQRVTVATSLTEATLENLYVAIGSKTEANGQSGDFEGPTTGDNYSLANADGTLTGPTASANVVYSGSAAGQVPAVLHLNGGALGQSPVERSICFVGAAPISLSSTAPAERIYILYRAVSVEAVGVAVKRDDTTVFPVSFRAMASEESGAKAPDSNASFGKIIDRVLSA